MGVSCRLASSISMSCSSFGSFLSPRLIVSCSVVIDSTLLGLKKKDSWPGVEVGQRGQKNGRPGRMVYGMDRPVRGRSGSLLPGRGQWKGSCRCGLGFPGGFNDQALFDDNSEFRFLKKNGVSFGEVQCLTNGGWNGNPTIRYNLCSGYLFHVW